MFVKIPNFDKYRLDTNLWLVYSLISNKYVFTKTVYNHYMVGLMDNNGKQQFLHLHRLIYETFNGPIPQGYIVHHKDGNGLNNNPNNLECMPLSKHLSLHHTGLKMKEAHNIKLHKLLSKPVEMLKDGVVVKEYPSQKSATEDGFNQMCISNCCLGKQKSHKGFQFRYKSADSDFDHAGIS